MQTDSARGRKVGRILHKAFTTPGHGIFGKTEMPEDAPPRGVARGSLEHLLFITLTVAIDYQRDAHELWAASRATYEDPQTRYVFRPKAVHQSAQVALAADLARHGLSRKRHRDAWIWRTVATSFLKKWGGDPRRFLDAHGNDAPSVLQRLREETHTARGRDRPDFPYLRGPKIAPLWVRMLRDNVGLVVKRMDAVPIPVDVHIARATLSLGVLRGTATMSFSAIVPPVQEAWRKAAAGTGLIALDFDEPLWHLSKFGCSRRVGPECPRVSECPVGMYCIPGTVRVAPSAVTVKTSP